MVITDNERPSSCNVGGGSAGGGETGLAFVGDGARETGLEDSLCDRADVEAVSERLIGLAVEGAAG